MSSHFIELTNPNHAYMFGFIQADGHMSEDTRNRGKVTIELKSSDEEILKTFASLIPYNLSITTRVRNTNFAQDYKSSCLTIHSLDFRNELLSLGIPYGKKSNVISTPSVAFSKRDYFRGIIDGDGSLGITSRGLPFVSLVTLSEELANAYIEYIYEITGKAKTTSRNMRDDVYNIAIYKEDAQAFVSELYYDGCIALSRKIESALEITRWIRPDNMRKIDFERRIWSLEEDSYIVSHSIEDSVVQLNRTAKSIQVRLWRLSKSNN
jgi:intein/homing endonuclease